MANLSQLVTRFKNLFTVHYETGAVHGPIDALHDLITELATRIESLESAAKAGVSPEIAAVIAEHQALHAVMKDAITNMSHRITLLENAAMAAVHAGSSGGGASSSGADKPAGTASNA